MKTISYLSPLCRTIEYHSGHPILGVSDEYGNAGEAGGYDSSNDHNYNESL